MEKLIFWAGDIGDKFGGFERYILLFCKLCINKGMEVIVVHEGENTVQVYRNSLETIGAKYLSVSRTLIQPQKSLLEACRLIQNESPNYIHINFSNPLLTLVAKLNKVQVIYKVCHTGLGYKLSLKSRASRWMQNFCVTRFFAVSERVLNEEINAGISRNKIFKNYLGLPLSELFDVNKINEPIPPYYSDLRKRKIITIGRFSPEKGLPFVCEVASKIVLKDDNIIWWLVGGVGNDFETCKRIVEKHSAQKNIFFLGQRNDVFSLLKNSYIQVLGSKFEGLPLNVVESSFAGVPTVGPNIKGIDEVISNYQSGLLTTPSNVDEMVSAITLLLEQPELREKFSKEAKTIVNKKFNSEIWINEILRFMEEDNIKYNSNRQTIK